MEYPFKDLLPLDEVLEREGYYRDWTHLDPEVFYSLTQISEYIKTKGFGVDVRLLIAQLAEHFGLKTGQVVDLANLLQQQFDNLEGVTQSFTNNINSLVAQMEAEKNAVIANATVDSEVILARGGKPTLQARLDDTDTQLSQTNSEVEFSKKLNSDLMKRLAQSVNQISKDIVFSRSNLDSWVHTEGIEIVDGKLAITDDSQTNAHANVALFKGIPNARSIEIELAGGFTARARMAFGKDEKNFFFGTFNANSAEMDFYRVENGSLVTSSIVKATLKANYQPVVGDRLRVTIHKQNVQIFINDNLYGTLFLTDEFKYLVDGAVMAGVGFRDAGSQRYEVNRVSISPERRYKYIHFSIDDIISVFEDISTNSGSYSSIFENATLNWLKNMHDRFGVVVSLFLFYQNENNTWNLSQMPTKYRNEFRRNADWLKLGFHGLDKNARYDGSTYTAQQALTHYNNTINQIKRFAHDLNIDVVPRTAFFTGDIDTVREWKNAPNGVKGFLSSDDDRTNMMYLDEVQRETLKYCDDFYDANEDLYFVKTDLRLENYTDPISELERKLDDYSLNGQHEILEVFTHEGPISGTTNKVKAEAVFGWGLDSGYVFDFPMNNIIRS